jgi:flavodoxin
MNSIVIYASHFGNTKRIAEAIADGLRAQGTASALSVDEAPTTFSAGTDLVVIGGPTEALRMTQPMSDFLDRIEAGVPHGIAAAAFDTRLHMPRWLLGSAAVGIERRLTQTGTQMVAPRESFYVAGSPAELVPGELERAKAWGAMLATKVAAHATALPA